MSNWEYKLQVLEGTLTQVVDILNTLGDDGWELVLSTDQSSIDVKDPTIINSLVVILKRPKLV